MECKKCGSTNIVKNGRTSTGDALVIAAQMPAEQVHAALDTLMGHDVLTRRR
jgi:hypothetical protein